MCGTRYTTKNKANNSHILARLGEGHTIDEFKQVVDNMYLKWHDNEYRQYLRPETLFGTKFESYLNISNLKKDKGVGVEDEHRKAIREYAERHGITDDTELPF